MNTQPTTVVVGLGGSKSSELALTWAADQAVLRGLTLTLVHAELASAAFGDATVVYSGGAQAVLRERGTQILEAGRERVARLAPQLPVTRKYEVDDTSNALLRHSKDAAMVVVGSHGRGPLRTLVLGSVGISLVKHAQCPVVVHRPGTSAGHSGGIVVAADALVESQQVLVAAWRQADLSGLPLTVLHCLGGGPFSLEPRSPDAAHARDEEARLALAECMAGLAETYPDVVADTRVEGGTPAEALTALRSEPDLVIVGAHQRSLVRQLARGVGSTAVSVVEHATCPVMVVPVGELAQRPSSRTGGSRPEAVASP